jgi:hypothetical protein
VGHSRFTFVIWKNHPGGEEATPSSSESTGEDEPDRKGQKTSWLVWKVSHDAALLRKVELIFGAEWRAEIGTLLAKNSFSLDRTLSFLEEMNTRGKRKGPDRHALLPVPNKRL